MKKDQQTTSYMIDGTKYNVHRQFDPNRQIGEILQREITRISGQNTLTEPREHGIMLS